MFVYVLMSCFVYVLMFLCSYVQRPYAYMVLCSYVLDHSDTHVVAYGARSRPDPLVGVSALTSATLQAMRDLSFVMLSCLYICFYVFSYV